MNFSEFLKENDDSYIKRLDRDWDDFDTLVDTHCVGYDYNKPIYRGMRDQGEMIIIQGDKGHRVSQNTSNHYTKLIDNEIKKENKDYPLRSKSIICTTDYTMAHDYGNSIYMIIPYTKTIIGMLPVNDIWNIDTTICDSAYKIAKWNNIWQSSSIEVSSFDDSNGLAERVIETIKSPKDNRQESLAELFEGFSDERIKNDIVNAYSLKTLDFTFSTYNHMNYKPTRELWIGGPCLAIKLGADGKIPDQ